MNLGKRFGAITTMLCFAALTIGGLTGCPSDAGLQASFNASPTSGEAPLPVTFQDTSAVADGNIVSWLWSFGDNLSSTDQNPVHTYAFPGTYTVSLQVVTDTGLSSRVERRNLITVGQGGPAPQAILEGRNRTGPAPLTVTFLDRSIPGGQDITFREWTFGDGGTSELRNPEHVYTRPGRYSVSLTVGNSLGSDTQTRLHYVEVTE
jgi:PKD repeat protein